MKEKKHCKWYNDEICTNGDSPCVADRCPCVDYPELCKLRKENLANEKELKPCPFCGGEVRKITSPFKNTQMFICDKCGADVCFYGAEFEPKATKAWNRRAEK